MKGIITTVLLTLIGLSVKSQSVRQIGGTGYDAVNDCISDKNGNLFVTGHFQGVANFGNNHIDTSTNATMDFFVAKYDRNDSCQWISTFGTADKESGMRIFQDDVGNIYTVFKYGDNFSGTPKWGFGQIDSTGKQTWNSWILGGQFVPVFTDFKSTSAGIEFLIMPYNTTNFSLYSYNASGTLLSNTYFSFPFNTNGSGCVIRLLVSKTDGAVLSKKTLTYPNTYLLDARFNEDSIIIAGGFIGSTQLGTIQLNATLGVLDGDALIASIDTSGNCGWAKSYSHGSMAQPDGITGIFVDGPSVYFFNSIDGMGSGKTYLSCYNRSTNSITSKPNVIYNNVFNVKTSKQKDILFVSTNIHSIATDMNIACYNLSLNLQTLQQTNIVNLNPNFSTVTSIVADSVHIYITGRFNSSVDFEGDSLTSIPGNIDDGFIFKKKYCFYPPDKPTITATGSMLTSSSVTGNQWYLNGNSIIGATSQTYNAMQTGNYTVIVSDENQCTSVSTPYQYPATGFEDELQSKVLVVPNPSDGRFKLVYSASEAFSIRIFNSVGRCVFESEQIASDIDLTGQLKGVYFISIVSKSRILNQRLLIE